MNRQDYTQANRAAWDASASEHKKGEEWQELLRKATAPGFSIFDDTMTATLQGLDIAGARTVQIGCNNGRELLSMPAFGALPVLGIDQSDGFLDQARDLARLNGSDCVFIRTDIYDLPGEMPGPFDLGLITIGVLNWMPDLPLFLRIVAGLLAPGGRLVIYETHPMLDMFEPDDADPFKPVRSYFQKDPQSWAETITYDGSRGDPAPQSYWFAHTIGEIVTGCVRAGLAIEQLTEYGHCNREVDYHKYEGRTAQIPLCYMLVVKKV